MNVRDLIEILKDYPEDTEVELGIVAPVEDDDQIAVDRYPIEGVLPWEDEEEDDAEPVLWLIGGEEDDVDKFLDAIEEGDEEGDDHDHSSAPAAPGSDDSA
jgi:hypothetical protein